MIIDCHGHYTTAPKGLQSWRDEQLAALKSGAPAAKGAVKISDDEIRDSLENAQLKLQRERGTDVTIFSPRASAMAHHIGDATTSLHWTEHCNDLIHRVCTLYPENFVAVCQLPQTPKERMPALWAKGTGYPGFQGVALPKDPEAEAEMNEPYIYHFPDGNASIARLLVRRLIPGVAPGATMEDIVMAPFDYSRLDTSGAKTRLRLNSTVVSLANGPGKQVAVGYVRGNDLKRVQAPQVVFAAYNMMLPYLAAELRQPQREALSAAVKAPLVYVKVAVRNWQPWVKAGVHEVTNPMGFYSRIKLDYPVSLGEYRFARTPREPIGLHLVHVPTPGLTGADQRAAWRAGRAILYATSYEEFEKRLIDELTRIVGQCRFQCATGHHCNQRVSLGSRLRVGQQQSLRQGSGARTDRDRPSTLRQHRNREFRCGRGCVRARGDRRSTPRRR